MTRPGSLELTAALAAFLGILAITAPVRAQASDGSRSGCGQMYVKTLHAARDAAARGDQKEAVARLEEARDILALCRNGGTGPPGSSEAPDAPVHVLGRAEDVRGTRG